ncbi:MAG: hypothetical protein ABW072_18910 [Sedimenticola sp.]
MKNVIVILFAILDCKVWSTAQVTAWADRLISKLDSPRAWLLDLSIGNSVESCLETVHEAIRESGMLLPEDIGELMAGFILLRYDSGELSESQARSLLVDVVDAYETSSIDAETAGVLSLDSSVYMEFRRSAKQALEHMNSVQFLESESELINDYPKRD